MAVKEGFEPSIRDKPYTPLAGERLQPLGHLTTQIMARSGGFEPPTAWFVARYSIQLSYERTLNSVCTIPLEEQVVHFK